MIDTTTFLEMCVVIGLVVILMVKRGMLKNFKDHGSVYPICKLFKTRSHFKPMDYEKCYENWDVHEMAHWSFKELNMQDDVDDWTNGKLTEPEKKFLIQILRYFTQGDVDVAAGYVEYLQMFKQPEVRMMLFGFGSREAVHIASYSHLISTLNLPDSTYQEFLKFKEMKDKHDFVFNDKFRSNFFIRFLKFLIFGVDVKMEEAAIKIATFSGFIEGVQLFSSFIMLLNFTRHGTLRKMGQIIQWSIADETHHTNSMIKLYHILLKECENFIRLDVLRDRVYWTIRRMIELEDNFIDSAFNIGDMRDLKREDVKTYIRYIADIRLVTMGYEGLYGITTNPLDWVENMVNLPSHTNFFENTSTEHAKASLTGQWR